MVDLCLHQNRGKIETDNQILFDDIIQKFTVPNPAYKFSKFSESTLSAISPFGSFDIGLTFDIYSKIKSLYPSEEIIISEELKNHSNPISITSDIGKPSNKKFKYRDYQEKAVKASLKYGRGISLLPTAAGKSLIIYGILSNLLKKVENNIILVPNLQLVTQMRDDLIEYGFDKNDISTFSSFSPELKNTKVVLTNRQWLEKFSKTESNRRKNTNTKLRKEREHIVNMSLSNFSKMLNKNEDKYKKYLKLLNENNKSFDFVKDKYIKDLNNKINNNKKRIENIENYTESLYNFKSIIIDEIHTINSKNKIRKYIKQLSTDIRFGLTGTMPENTYEQWHIKGLIGPVLHNEKAYTLQKRKFIADVNIITILINHRHVPSFVDYNIKYTKPSLFKEQCEKAFYNEWQYIESFQPSNRKISALASKLKGNTLVMFDHTEHGKTLFNLIDSKNKYFIDGSVELEDRNDIKSVMEKNTDTVLVGNVKAIGTGISIKNIDNIIFAISGKGVTKIIQALGRGMRLRKGKRKVNLFDIYHNFFYSRKHFKKRKELYNEFYKLTNFQDKIINIS